MEEVKHPERADRVLLQRSEVSRDGESEKGETTNGILRLDPHASSLVWVRNRARVVNLHNGILRIAFNQFAGPKLVGGLQTAGTARRTPAALMYAKSFESVRLTKSMSPY